MRLGSGMLPLPSDQVAFRCHDCAEVTVKVHRRCCLGRVDDATWDNFDNRLYVLKTGYRFTGFRFNKPSRISIGLLIAATALL